MALGLRAKALEAQNKSLTHYETQWLLTGGMLVMIWSVALRTLNSGDPLWVKDLFWASRSLARNPKVMTRAAASTKSILLAYGLYAFI